MLLIHSKRSKVLYTKKNRIDTSRYMSQVIIDTIINVVCMRPPKYILVLTVSAQNRILNAIVNVRFKIRQ